MHDTFIKLIYFSILFSRKKKKRFQNATGLCRSLPIGALPVCRRSIGGATMRR